MEIINDGDRAVISPRCDIVASAVNDLRQELKKIMAEGVKELTIDMTGVEIIDSSGLGLFIATHNSLNKAGGKLAVTQTTADILSLFKSMRLDQHFTVKGA